MNMNLPNKLTMARIVMIPLFVIALLFDNTPGRIIACVLFCVASFTDFLDGYLARKHNLVTNFGKLMDPLADKLLVASAMIVMVQTGDLAAWIVILIIAREFAITALRSLAASEGIVVAASNLGKIKTNFQMFGLILLILKPFVIGLIGINLGLWLMYIALFFTLYSGYDYFAKLKNQIKWS